MSQSIRELELEVSSVVVSNRSRIAYLRRMIRRIDREVTALGQREATGTSEKWLSQVGAEGYGEYRRQLAAELAELERAGQPKPRSK